MGATIDTGTGPTHTARSEPSVGPSSDVDREPTGVVDEPVVVVGEGGTEGRDPLGRRDRPRRRWLRLLLALVLLGVGYYVVSLYQVWSTGRGDGARPADAIVVLGAAQYDGTPSPQLAARLDHAAELWHEGLAAVVMVTGGKQPGDRFTEAEASRAYLLDLGVPDDAIRLENDGRTTYGSLAHAAGLLRAEGITDVVLVTDPYHSLRSRLIAEEVGLDATVSPTPTSVVTGTTSLRRHVQEAAGVAVGRIVGFERLTDLTG